MSTEVMTTTTTTTDVVAEAQVEVVVDPMVRQLNMMAELLDTLGKTSKALTVEMKMLTRDVNKMRIASAKGGKGSKRVKKVVDPDVPRKLGALEKPVPITDELADFLGLTKGEMFSRQFITQSINKFVKDNELQNPENRRYILLESEAGLKLKALLRDPDQPLTFFNIQRYLKVHYPKVETDESETKAKTPRAKGKSVDATDTTTPASTDRTTTSETPSSSTSVVPDADKVDETTDSEAPKKKVVRKVVKKA
jgi:chromatin remodeling complex protein RSC6